MSVKEHINIKDKILGKVINMNDNNVHLIINEYVLSHWMNLVGAKNFYPSKIVNLNDQIEILVLDFDDEKEE